MKGFIYSFFGESAGRVILATWGWLWGKEIEKGGHIAAAVSRDAVGDMETNLHAFSDAVATQISALNTAQRALDHQQSVVASYNAAAEAAYGAGDEEGALEAFAAVTELEPLIAQIQKQVNDAKTNIENSQGELKRKQTELRQYKLKSSALEAAAQISESLASINKKGTGDESAKNAFDKAERAILAQGDTQMARVQLSGPSESDKKLLGYSTSAAVNDKMAALKAKMGK